MIFWSIFISDIPTDRYIASAIASVCLLSHYKQYCCYLNGMGRVIGFFLCGQTGLKGLESHGNYSATSNDMKSVDWPLMGGLLHSVQRGGEWVGRSLPSPLLAIPL